jgi:hypothetical protein
VVQTPGFEEGWGLGVAVSGEGWEGQRGSGGERGWGLGGAGYMCDWNEWRDLI